MNWDFVTQEAVDKAITALKTPPGEKLDPKMSALSEKIIESVENSKLAVSLAASCWTSVEEDGIRAQFLLTTGIHLGIRMALEAMKGEN